MTDRKKHHSLRHDGTSDDESSSQSNDDSSLEKNSPAQKKNRRSNRLKSNRNNKNEEQHETVTKGVKRNSNEADYSIKSKSGGKKGNSKKNELRIHSLLRNAIQEAFGYTLKDIDIDFMKNQFTGLPVLDETWARIGFNKETQENRLKNFYEKLNEHFSGIIEGEEDLETEIIASIEAKTKKAKKISLELGTKFDDSKLSKLATILLKDEWIKKETHKLESERERRLNEFDELASIEEKLCQRLKLKTTELLKPVPNMDDLSQLNTRIKDLNALAEQRMVEMNRLCEEIAKLHQDLPNVSRNDSFVEGILFDSTEELPLSEEDINRANDVFNYLQKKNSDLNEEIRSNRSKIKELWQKLNIENNPALKHFILQSPGELNSAQLDIELKRLKKNKQQLAEALQIEYEECVKIKMQNMQKFIETVRVEIRKICVDMFYGPNEMKKLNDDFLTSTDFTEDLLLRHEEKLEDLKFKYEESEALYKKTSQWMEVWTEFLKFEEITKDPSRLTKRGYSTLDEARKRTAFEKQLPKLFSEISELATDYEKLNGGISFTINDLYFSEYIERKKYDHEENKQNERKEKQIMKDQIKKNESKFGISKISTPVRNKRKMPLSNLQLSKMIKTDSTLCGTPSLSSTRATAVETLKPKLTVHDKMKGRKSKTPKRKSLRKSLKSRQQKVNKPVKIDQDDTLASDLTLKTTIVSSFASSNTTRSNITNMTNTSNMTTSSNKFNFNYGISSNKSKGPPLSTSSKYVANSERQVMTSTASNSMLEEEDFNDLENFEQPDSKSKTTDKARLLALATAKMQSIGRKNTISAMSSGSQFNFRFQPNALKYDEFSREIAKTNKTLKESNC